jgi:hypothetical protein
MPTIEGLSMTLMKPYCPLSNRVDLLLYGSSRDSPPPTTVYRRLIQSLGFTTRYFRWVPHALSDA